MSQCERMIASLKILTVHLPIYVSVCKQSGKIHLHAPIPFRNYTFKTLDIPAIGTCHLVRFSPRLLSSNFDYIDFVSRNERHLLRIYGNNLSRIAFALNECGIAVQHSERTRWI